MAKTETIHAMLAQGRHRLDPGRACEVAAIILAQPKKAAQLIECLWDEDAGVANRAADALERVSCKRPDVHAAWKESLIGLMAETDENKLRWNLALSIPRLKLTRAEIRRVAACLRMYLDDRGSIVKTAAMQGLADLARQDAAMLPEVVDLLRILSRSGTAAMRARGRILLKKLEPNSEGRPLRKQPPLTETPG